MMTSPSPCPLPSGEKGCGGGFGDDEAATQVLLHRGALVGRAEAERDRPPESLAADAAVLGLEHPAHGLARRARHAVHVGLETLAHFVRVAPARDQGIGLVGRLEPGSRERLVTRIGRRPGSWSPDSWPI